MPGHAALADEVVFDIPVLNPSGDASRTVRLYHSASGRILAPRDGSVAGAFTLPACTALAFDVR